MLLAFIIGSLGSGSKKEARESSQESTPEYFGHLRGSACDSGADRRLPRKLYWNGQIEVIHHMNYCQICLNYGV